MSTSLSLERSPLSKQQSPTLEQKSEQKDSGIHLKIDFQVLNARNPHYSVAKDVYQKETRSLGEKPREFQRLNEHDSRHRCELMLCDEKPVAIIVYRKILRTCPDDGFKNAFDVELLTTFKNEDSAKYGFELIERMISLSEQMHAQSIHLPISLQSQTLADQLKQRGFACLEKGRNIPEEQNHYYRINSSIARGMADLVREANREASSFGREQKSASSSSSSSQALDHKRKRSSIELSYGHPQNQADVSYLEEKRRKVDTLERNPIRETPDQRYRSDYMEFQSRPSYQRSQSSGSLAPYSSREAQKNHELTLRKIYIHQIRNGEKTVEGRINSGVVLNYRPGDKIRFFYKANQSDDVRCTILKIEKYANFKDMLEKVGYKKCLAEVRSLPDAIRIYDQIPTYPERARQNGVVAIHLKVDKE